MFNAKISVRSLVEFIFRSGDITSGDGSFNKDAMQQGSKIHRKIQGKMGLDYEAEVPLKIDIVRPDFILTIEGRADGILREKDGVTIDEIKGVYKKLERMECPIFVHQAQAMCYAYIYALHNDLETITVQMTYCNMDTEEIKRFYEDFTFAQLEEWFSKLVEDYCKWVQFDVDSRRLRDDTISNLKFPYDYRKGQKDMAGTVYYAIKNETNLFVQAPTGIGKTMAAIYPSVHSMGEGNGEKIFYLTAKTIARSVALNGFDILRGKGLHFRSVLITAKEKICPQEKTVCDGKECPYAAGHYDRINDALFDLVTNELNITRDVIIEYANKHMVCPFELSLDASLFVDGIICDYNYVFDPRVKLRRYFAEGGGKNFIFLVDEAHNLIERASAMYSAEIYKEDFLAIKKIMVPYHKKISNLLNQCNNELLKYKKMCLEGQSYVLIPDIEDLYIKLLRLIAHFESFFDEMKDIKDLKPYEDELLEFYFRIKQFVSIYETLDESYEIYGEQVNDKLFMLKLYCIHPANHLAECIEQSRSTVFFSATMLPIKYYRELLHDEEEDYAIYIPSPFPNENRGLFACVDVSSRYRMRGPLQYEKIGRYLDIMTRTKPGHYMAFFPSYKMLGDVYEKAMERGLLSQINVICQSPNMTEEEREEFLHQFDEDAPPVLGLCILGGIFSEGIDLVGESLIGVAVVGTGLPMVCNEREIQQQYFESRKQLGFDYAYLYPGMNKVQQAAGRVIRTMTDRGVILLMDDRFVTNQVVETFPMEWADYEIAELNTIEQKLMNFWKKSENEACQE